MTDDAPILWAEGILGPTPIATPSGWRAADSLRLGDEVLCFDSGVARVQRADRLEQAPGGAALPDFWPVLIPEGVLDNRSDMQLMAEQRLLLECDMAEARWGEPFMLIPAAALVGYRGIARIRPDPEQAAIRLGFARDEIVYASRGVLIFCPRAELVAPYPPPDYPAPDLQTARALVAEVAAQGGFAALPRRP